MVVLNYIFVVCPCHLIRICAFGVLEKCQSLSSLFYKYNWVAEKLQSWSREYQYN